MNEALIVMIIIFVISWAIFIHRSIVDSRQFDRLAGVLEKHLKAMETKKLDDWGTTDWNPEDTDGYEEEWK